MIILANFFSVNFLRSIFNGGMRLDLNYKLEDSSTSIQSQNSCLSSNKCISARNIFERFEESKFVHSTYLVR